jgi:hypothetical protein
VMTMKTNVSLVLMPCNLANYFQPFMAFWKFFVSGLLTSVCLFKDLVPSSPPLYLYQFKVNNSSVKCDLFNIKTHKTPYMFQPAVGIIRGSPTLWGNTLHISHVYSYSYSYLFVL